MFTRRPAGTTLRRTREALLNPYPASSDRWDPWFIVEMRCQKCGRLARAPRREMQEAMREHLESDCPMRNGPSQDEVQMMRIFFPWQ